LNEFLALEYIDKVLSGKITTCSWVKFAVNRHVQDLKDSKGKDFPYYFDEKSAQRVIMFAQDQRHTKGEWAKQRLKLTLEPWQQFIIWVILDGSEKDSTPGDSQKHISK